MEGTLAVDPRCNLCGAQPGECGCRLGGIWQDSDPVVPPKPEVNACYMVRRDGSTYSRVWVTAQPEDEEIVVVIDGYETTFVRRSHWERQA